MNNKLKYFLIIILFFVTNDAITFGTSGNQILAFFNQVLYALLSVYLIFTVKNISSNKKSGFVFFLFLICILITLILNQDSSQGYLIQINALLLGYLTSIKLQFKQFVRIFNQLLFYLSVFGIVCFFVFIFFPNLLFLLPSFENISQTKYINLLFYAQFFETESSFISRNASIFREPGVYMIYLNIGILFELFLKDKINKYYLSAYIVALITTLSTGGYVVFIFIVVSYLIKEKDFKKLATTAIFGIFLAVFIWSKFVLFENTLTKFDSESEQYGSALARFSSLTVPFAIFLDNPFGVGLANFAQIYETYAYNLVGIRFRADSHATNTLFSLLGAYGFVYFLLCNLAFFMLSKKISNVPIIKILLFLAFVMLLSNQDIRYSLLFTILLFYGFSVEFKSNKKIYA